MKANVNKERDFSAITPEIKKLAKLAVSDSYIEPSMYTEHKVFRGLRDLDGNGVLTGLTEISEIVSKTRVGDELVPCPGKLYYRGYDIEKLVAGFLKDSRFGFEEITYLLLFGELPNKEQLKDFSALLASYRSLPSSFTRDIIMKAPSTDDCQTSIRA